MPEPEDGNKGVTIVGGGLVGSLLAVSLGQRGLRVHLHESRSDIRRAAEVSGRSINLALSRRGREAVRAVGLEDEVLSTAIPMRARMIHPVSGNQYSIPYGTKRDDCIYSVNRRALNELLLTKAEESPNISIHTLVFSDGATGKKTVQTEFVFGCDGAHSTVRRQMMRWGRLNYQQEYIQHGYRELTMPPTPSGDLPWNQTFLHIWPHHEFMMIALPNRDKSFTLTLFMPCSVFESIRNEKSLLAFFPAHFPDSINKIGVERLYKDYFANPQGKMISVKCSPHFMAGNTLILGDAAHAVVPFYGQGMNAVSKTVSY
ncbi:Kynurenine 3-monooxygenase [Geodia barretti]|uniref:Kynurenine 3-monooxygenase n=1 Tax=Geodia barretti TaxID=519541 RepID=A0AA35TCC3_GEOBA|nr:Kynurenine 3-monooxygenase [Geodia barretti]